MLNVLTVTHHNELSNNRIGVRLPIVLLVVFSAFARGDVSAQTIRDLIGTNFNVRVIAVGDGDTVDAIPVGEQRAIRLRLEGIDAPERGEPFSQEARNAARLLLFGQTVRVEGRDVDRYGRLVARIRVAGKDVSSEFVRAGLACRYREYSSDPVLAKAEADARAAGRGFWARGAAKPRCVTTQAQTRRGGGNAANSPASATVFHGNITSRVYHARSCRNFNCRDCTRIFATEAAAKAAEFRPAEDCLRQQ